MTKDPQALTTREPQELNLQAIADTTGFSIGAIWKWVTRWEAENKQQKENQNAHLCA